MPRTRIPGIVRLVSETAWAIQPEKLDAILEVLELRANGGSLTPAEAAARAGARERPAARTAGSVAVLPLYGVVSQRMNMLAEISGGTSTEQFGKELRALVDDPEIAAIVLDIDSPGGTVSGVPELAAEIRAARGTKPIVAVANTLMASAAYWIASQADQIVAAPSASVGSIGVFAVHTDASGADAEAGLKRTIIRAGKYKAEGNPYEPLSDEAREAVQAMIDDTYAMFVADVAKGRGVSAKDVRDGYGEGRSLPAKQALAAGLVDRVATLDTVVRELARGKSVATRGARAEQDTAPRLVATMDGVELHVTAAALDQMLVEDRRITLFATDPPSTLADPPPLLAQASVAQAVASPAAVVVSTLPAPQARSSTVDTPNTAATGAATADSAELARRDALTAFAKGRNKDAAWISRAVAEGWTLGRAQAEEIEALDATRAAAVTLPNPQGDAVVTTTYGQQAGAVHDYTASRTGVQVGATREASRPFARFGDYLTAVMQASTPGAGEMDIRLRPLAATTGMHQSGGVDGGFTVSPQFSSMIWDKMNESPDSLLARTDNYTVTGESLTFNANAETSRATGSRWGGVQAYWINEADQITSSRPKFRQAKIEPQELAVLVYATDKLIRNSPIALEQYVTRAAASEIDFMTGNAIVNGLGNGQPKGLLASASLVSVAKETSQAAATINQINISKMWARLHPRSRANAVWLHNVDVEPQLDQLSTTVRNVADSENVGGYANKVWDAERRTLKGRPVIACEYCATLGTKGDLLLVDLSGYLTGTRGGVESAMSMHLRFDYAETAFRFIYAVDGQPWLASALTPFKGTNSLTTHVSLDTRA